MIQVQVSVSKARCFCTERNTLRGAQYIPGQDAYWQFHFYPGAMLRVLYLVYYKCPDQNRKRIISMARPTPLMG